MKMAMMKSVRRRRIEMRQAMKRIWRNQIIEGSVKMLKKRVEEGRRTSNYTKKMKRVVSDEEESQKRVAERQNEEELKEEAVSHHDQAV